MDSGKVLRVVAKIVTLCFIGYLFLLAPFGRSLQALVEGYVGPRGALALAVICLVAAGLFTRRSTSKIELLSKGAVSLVICLVINQFILYPVEWSHVAHYAALSILLSTTFKLSPLLSIAIASGVGLIDESLQGISPDRVFDLRDICLNVVGAVVGIGIQSVSTDSLRERGKKITNG